jgi:hypothetical protein
MILVKEAQKVLIHDTTSISHTSTPSVNVCAQFSSHSRPRIALVTQTYFLPFLKTCSPSLPAYVKIAFRSTFSLDIPVYQDLPQGPYF